MGSALVHEIAEGHNDRIKQFYWKLWYRDDEVLPKIDLKQKFVGPNITINASTVETFYSVVGNQGESFRTVRNSSVKAPMDFAVVPSWQVSNILLSLIYTKLIFAQSIIQSIFPVAIDGDLLKLVHLSNGINMVKGARPLQVGNVCNAEVYITSVTNTNAGKVVKTKVQVYHEGKLVTKGLSSFLY